ncbi:nucleic acid binding protein 1 [Hordeum vulgare]|nr:nucleic acid binding protein 1 [Hordeum vulgare]
MSEDESVDSITKEEPTVEVEEEVWEYVKSSEEAKVYVWNLPYNVSSECLAQLLGQAGVLQVSKPDAAIVPLYTHAHLPDEENASNHPTLIMCRALARLKLTHSILYGNDVRFIVVIVS